MDVEKRDRNVILLRQDVVEQLDEVSERLGIERETFVNQILTRLLSRLRVDEGTERLLREKRTIPDEMIEKVMDEYDELLRRLA